MFHSTFGEKTETGDLHFLSEEKGIVCANCRSQLQLITDVHQTRADVRCEGTERCLLSSSVSSVFRERPDMRWWQQGDANMKPRVHATHNS